MFTRNFNKALALLASLLILCSVLPMSALFSAGADVEGNLVVNGDFENGKNGWTFSNAAEIVTDANNGSGALKLTNPNVWSEAAIQTVTVEPNAEYRIEWYSKRVSGSGVFNLILCQNVSPWGNATTVSGQNWMIETSGNWVKNEYVVNVGDNTSMFFKLTAQSDNAGSIIIDDIVMTKVGGGNNDQPGNDQPAEEIEVVNGDFETGDNTGWETYNGSAVKAEAAHDGSYGMHLIGNGSWNGIAYQDVAVEPGKEYTISMYLKAVAVGVNVQIKDGSSSGTKLAEQWVDATEWTLVEFKVTPTSDKLHINFCGGGKGTAESVYLDDITVTAKVSDEPDEPGEPVNPSDELLVNGNFETGDTTGWDNLWNSNTVSVVEGRNSAYAMNVISGMYTHVRQKVTVEPNTDYIITGWYKDVNKMTLLIKDGGDAANLHQEPFADGTAEWTEITFEFNSGSNTELLISLMGTAAGAKGTFDDLSLTKKKADEPVVPSDELLVNGDFETGDTTGWDNLWNSNTVSVVEGHNSAYAMNVISGQWKHVRQTVAVEPNTDYIITGWYKDVNKMSLVVKDGADTKNLYQASFTDGTAEWTKVVLTVNSGSETSLIISLMGNEDGAKGIFDDFSMTKATDEPNVELITNGDFETGDTTGWENLWDSNTIEMAEGRESVYAMSVISGKWKHVRQTVTVEPNTDYVITGWYKDVNKMALIVKDGADSKDMYNASFTDGTAEWKKVVLEINSGSETSLIISLMGNEDGAKGIFDDFSMTKATDEPVTPTPDFPPVEENQLKNGGFEEGTAGWNWVDPTKLDDTNAFQGNNSAYLDNAKQYGEALTQRVPLRPDTDYVIIFYTKRDSGSKAWNLFLMDASTVDSGAPVNIKFVKSKSTNWFQQPASDGWVKTELEFNSGSVAEAMFKFGPGDDNAGTFWLDNVGLYVKGNEPTEEPTEEGKSSMSLTSYGVVNNRPVSADKNLLQNGDFESTGGQWDVDTFHTEHVSVVEDSTAKSGSKTLFFNTSALEEQDDFVQPTFWLELQPNTDYVFSAWLKGAMLSEDNCGRATIGIVNTNGKFLSSRDILFLDGSRQIVPTAWDDQWHLRSVQFNTGTDPESSTIKVGIALSGWGSKLWIDDMALFLVGDGTKYMSVNMAGGIKLDYSFNRNTIGCDDEDSLIPDPNMKKADESGFWAGSYGWRNGFVSFVENRYEYGASMKYTSTGDNADTYMIKWVDVEPNTQYTFAVDIKILEDGFGRLGLLDDKLRDKVEFFKVSFDSYDYDDSDNTGWRTVVTSFNTDVYGRIGIAIVDGGGEVLLDNMRLFKTADAKYVEDYYVAPPAPKDDFNANDEADDDTTSDTEPEQEVVKKVKKKVKTAPSGIDPMIWVWIGAGSAVALAGAAVVIILLVKKRKKAAAAAAAAAAVETTADEPTPDASAE